MKKAEIVARLSKLGKDRVWLAEQIPYTYDTTRNSLADKAKEPSKRFLESCERAILEEERRSMVDPDRPNPSVWELVYFNGTEIRKIDQAQKIGGYETKEQLYHDAVIDFCDHILTEEKKSENHLKLAEDDPPFPS